MNIKNIKALKEAGAYPEDRIFDHYLIEDIPPPDNGRCMPYFNYPIPGIKYLIILIAKIVPYPIKIEITNTEMGWLNYRVQVQYNVQDTVIKEFNEPFLDDALASALLHVKEEHRKKDEFFKSLPA